MMSKEKHIKAVGVTPEWADIARRLLAEGPDAFNAENIYSGRNRIYRLEIGDVPIAVKFFSRSLKNRLVYSIFSSKAERSYLYAQELLRRGIATPQPLAYAERRGPAHTLQDSLYICRFEEATDLRDYLETGPEAWREFARFAALLHDKGILHRDLNNTNVRINLDDEGRPHFSLIDLNRIKFLPAGNKATGKEAARNLVRFSWHTPEFEMFAREYSALRHDDGPTFEEIIEAKRRHDR